MLDGTILEPRLSLPQPTRALCFVGPLGALLSGHGWPWMQSCLWMLASGLALRGYGLSSSRHTVTRSGLLCVRHLSHWQPALHRDQGGGLHHDSWLSSEAFSPPTWNPKGEPLQTIILFQWPVLKLYASLHGSTPPYITPPCGNLLRRRCCCSEGASD